MLPDVRDDPYFQNSQLTHKNQHQPDSIIRPNAQPEQEQIFFPSPGKSTLVCAASLGTGVKAKVRLLVWKGKIGKWCLDQTHILPSSGETTPGAFTWTFNNAGHISALWLEEISGGQVEAIEAVLVDHNIGKLFCINSLNTNNTLEFSANTMQRFSGILNEQGELAIIGTNLLSLTPSVTYISKPKDVNCHLYVEVISDNQAIIKNTGEKLNAGVSVKGKFE